MPSQHRRLLAAAWAHWLALPDSFHRSLSFVLPNACVRPFSRIKAPVENMFKIIFLSTGDHFSRHTPAPGNQGGDMPYPSGHRAAVKRNIIDSARKLFN